MKTEPASASRRYQMRRRAESVATTRARIIRSTIDLSLANRTLTTTLGQADDRAGVSVQTVLRHIGSRDDLMEAAVDVGLADVRAERTPTGPDHGAAITALLSLDPWRGAVARGTRGVRWQGAGAQVVLVVPPATATPPACRSGAA